MWRHTLLFIALVPFTLAALQIRGLEDIPEKYKGKKGCYVSALDEMIPVGQSAGQPPFSEDISKCVQYRCQETSVVVAGCSPASGSTAVDANKAYPDCCPQPVPSEAVNA